MRNETTALRTLSSNTKSIRCLPSGLMSFKTKAMTMSIPFDSWRAMADWKDNHNKKLTEVSWNFAKFKERELAPNLV